MQVYCSYVAINNVMDYKAKTEELLDIRNDISKTMKGMIRKQTLARFGVYEFDSKNEFTLWNLYQSLKRPFRGFLEIKIP